MREREKEGKTSILGVGGKDQFGAMHAGFQMGCV